MFCLNELTVLLDAALQSIGCPPPTCDNHRACPATAAHGWYARKCNNICPIAAELLLFRAAACLRRGSLICEAVRERSSAGLGFATLQPCNNPPDEAFMLDAPSGHGVRSSLGTATISNLLLLLLFCFFFVCFL